MEYKILTEIVSKLNSSHINTTINAPDGRVESAYIETPILTQIEKLCDNVYIPKIRHWFDFALLLDNEQYIPVNIKATSGNLADNIGNLAPIVYALTDFEMKYNKHYNSGELVDLLSDENIKEINRDYWFLVYLKLEKKFIINSIKGCSTFTANKSNLPFQIKWKDNKEYNRRTSCDTWNHIKEIYKHKQRSKDTWQIKFLKTLASRFVSYFSS